MFVRPSDANSESSIRFILPHGVNRNLQDVSIEFI